MSENEREAYVGFRSNQHSWKHAHHHLGLVGVLGGKFCIAVLANFKDQLIRTSNSKGGSAPCQEP
jgi:hypothetical protein